MRTYIRIAGRFMAQYPQRTIALIISIALSVFLIVAIGSLSQSVRKANVISCINERGAQHVIYHDSKFDIEKVKILRGQPSVKSYAKLFYYGSWKTQNGLDLNLLAADTNILHMNSTRMLAGRYPQRSHEIAMEGWVLNRLRLPHALGQNLSIELQEQGVQQNFTLVGIIKDRMDAKASGQLESFIAFNQENLLGRAPHRNALNILVEFKDGVKINQAIKQTGQDLGLKINDENVLPNRMLLAALGQLDEIDWYLVAIALMLALVGGMVIYSIYNISVLKRIQDYGMLRAVGATTRQIIYLVIVEIVIIYVLGTTLGLVSGSALVQLFRGVTTDVFPTGIEADNLRLDVIVISGFAVILSLVVALGAVLGAGIRAILMTTSLSPIEAINRSTQDDKIRFSDKDSCWERLWGIPKKISLKNLKRNRKVMVFTIIAMSIGCTLFMFESFKMEYFHISSDNFSAISSFYADEFGLNVNEAAPMSTGYSPQQISELQQLAPVSKIKAMQVLYSRLKLSPNQLNGAYGDNYIKYMNIRESNYSKGHSELVNPGWKYRFAFTGDKPGELVIRNTVLGLADRDLATLNQVLGKGRSRTGAKERIPSAIVYIPQVNAKGSFSHETGNTKFQPTLNIQAGDQITITFPRHGYDKSMDNSRLIWDYENNKVQYVDQVFKVAGIIKTPPEADQYMLGSETAPYLYVSERVLQGITGIKSYRIISIHLKDNYSPADYRLVKEKVQHMADLIPGTLLEDKVEFIREYEQSGRQYYLLIGSIALILIIIGGLSIYNNIYYNLISRRREFGIMQAIGLTRRQFRSMIGFEGLMYGAISAAFSIVLALILDLGLFLDYTYIYPDSLLPKAFFIEWKSMLIVILVNLAVGYLATRGPARQADQMDISEAIRALE